MALCNWRGLAWYCGFVWRGIVASFGVVVGFVWRGIVASFGVVEGFCTTIEFVLLASISVGVIHLTSAQGDV